MVLLGGLLLSALLLAACQASPREAAAPGPGGPLAKVKLGHIPILIFAPFYVGIEKGYFAQEGIEVELQAFQGGGEILTQLAAGNLDVGAGGVGGALLNFAKQALDKKQAPPPVVAPLHSERPPLTTPLVVGKRAFDRGDIKAVRDLKGKKLAVNSRGAATHYWLELALRQGGLTIKDIELVILPFDQVPAALASGAIAGAMLGEPLVTLAAQRGQVHVLSKDFLDGLQPTAVFYNAAWARRNPERARGFMAAYLRAARDLQGDGWQRDEHLAILQKHTRVDPAVIKASNRPYFEPNGKIDVKGLEEQQKFFRDTGDLTYKELLDVRKIIDTSFVDQAVKRLGTYKAP